MLSANCSFTRLLCAADSRVQASWFKHRVRQLQSNDLVHQEATCRWRSGIRGVYYQQHPFTRTLPVDWHQLHQVLADTHLDGPSELLLLDSAAALLTTNWVQCFIVFINSLFSTCNFLSTSKAKALNLMRQTEVTGLLAGWVINVTSVEQKAWISNFIVRIPAYNLDQILKLWWGCYWWLLTLFETVG